MPTSALNAQSRTDALARLRGGDMLDVLVVGGGITGAGIALDAAGRGLATAIVEAQDWASGTSSRSSKLVHGGLRYLEMFDFKLVHEALVERDLLLSRIAPHLVQPISFLYPLTRPVWERAYVTSGISLYDVLARLRKPGEGLPIHHQLSKAELLKEFPSFSPDAAVGAIRYFDAKVDDARLVIYLIRTAQERGALAANRTQVVGLIKDGERVTGATLEDRITGERFDVAARHVVLATGVWTEETEKLAGSEGGLSVLASKGAHIVVPREKINGTSGIISQTDKSVLFIIPWQRYWIIGTTDTPWHEDVVHPVATAKDIDYLLNLANRLLADPIERDDIIGVWAGLRPLLQPGTKEGTESAKLSREHTVASLAPGLVSIAGGKLTTYRVMAKDAVDFALGDEAKTRPSITDQLPLVGAIDVDEFEAEGEELEQRYGWSPARRRHLLRRYGAKVADLTALIDADKDLGRPLAAAPAYLRAEVRYAVTHEGALHLDDVLMHRVRLNYEQRDRGWKAAHEIAELMAEAASWDRARTKAELANYKARCDAQAAAEQAESDAEAEELRTRAPELTGMRRPPF